MNVGPSASKPEPDIGSTHRIAQRLTAGLLACAAAVGFCAGYEAVLGRTGSLTSAAGIMVSYFTNTTALLVAGLFTGITVTPRRCLRSWLVAGAALSVLLVGTVQHLVLAGLQDLHGGDAVADILLHDVLPLGVPLFWLAFASKGSLRCRHPLLWALYPLAFLAATLVRGAVTGWYPYPFVDVARTGWVAVSGNVGGIAGCFVLTGWAFIVLDRLLAHRYRRRT